MSLGLVVLEKKLFTRTRTPTPQSDDIKTITQINLKFGGEVFYGVQADSSKFGVICLKIKVRKEFYLFLIGNIHSETVSLHHIRKKSIFYFLMMSLLSDVTMQLSL